MDVGVIPEGARDILVKEVEEAGNFLALKSESSEEYFLNGNFIIQWNGEYKAGGTTFYYERSGNMENLTAPGPTKQPVMLQVCRCTTEVDCVWREWKVFTFKINVCVLVLWDV